MKNRKLLTKFWNILLVLPLMLISLFLSAGEVEVFFPGKTLSNAEKIKAYSASWKQLVLNQGKWQQAAIIHEKLSSIDGKHWQHIQTNQVGQSKNLTTRKLRKSDLFTLHMFQKLSGKNGQPKSLEVTYGKHQLQRKLVMPDNKIIEQQAHLPFDGWDGFIFGLTIYGLPLEDKKTFRIPAVMPNFMNGYWVDVSISDGGTVELNGKIQAVWYADASWLNLHDGDTYQPGPEGSGGRYVIFKQPAIGQPAVYRYKTDTVDIKLK